MSTGKGPGRFRDFVPPYQPTKTQTLTASGTVIAGTAGYQIVIEYFTAQNKGSASIGITPKNGTVPFDDGNVIPSTEGSNFYSFGAPAPGREWRCDAGSPFVVTLSASGSVATNTRYWLQGTA